MGRRGRPAWYTAADNAEFVLLLQAELNVLKQAASEKLASARVSVAKGEAEAEKVRAEAQKIAADAQRILAEANGVEDVNLGKSKKSLAEIRKIAAEAATIEAAAKDTESTAELNRAKAEATRIDSQAKGVQTKAEAAKLRADADRIRRESEIKYLDAKAKRAADAEELRLARKREWDEAAAKVASEAQAAADLAAEKARTAKTERRAAAAKRKKRKEQWDYVRRGTVGAKRVALALIILLVLVWQFPRLTAWTWTSVTSTLSTVASAVRANMSPKSAADEAELEAQLVVLDAYCDWEAIDDAVELQKVRARVLRSDGDLADRVGNLKEGSFTLWERVNKTTPPPVEALLTLAALKADRENLAVDLRTKLGRHLLNRDDARAEAVKMGRACEAFDGPQLREQLREAKALETTMEALAPSAKSIFQVRFEIEKEQAELAKQQAQLVREQEAEAKVAGLKAQAIEFVGCTLTQPFGKNIKKLAPSDAACISDAGAEGIRDILLNDIGVTEAARWTTPELTNFGRWVGWTAMLAPQEMKGTPVCATTEQVQKSPEELQRFVDYHKEHRATTCSRV